MPIVDSASSSGAGREQFNCEAHNNHPTTKISNSNSNNNSNNSNNNNNNNANSEWGLTQKSLEEALEANRELQMKLLSELARITQRKRDNRLEAERCIERSCVVVIKGETATTTSLPLIITKAESESESMHDEKDDRKDEDGTVKRAKKRKKKKVIGDVNYLPTNGDINELLFASDKDENEIENENSGGQQDDFDLSKSDENETEKAGDDQKTEKKWSLHLRKKFKNNPFRKWTSEYFADPTGSCPNENEDSIRRRILTMKTKQQNGPSSSTTKQQQDQDETIMIPDTFFFHTSQPFTPKERARLHKWLFQDGKYNKWVDNEDDDSNLFYEGIAHKLRQEHHENLVERKKDKVLLPSCVSRSAEGIRLFHKYCLASRYEFTKEESLVILESVEEAATIVAAASLQKGAASQNNGEESTQLSTIDHNKESDMEWNPNQAIDWQKICHRVLELHLRRQSSSGPRNAMNDFSPITPYQCMVHYKRKLRPQPDGSFTPEEDELLLRYIAVMGPQFVWGYQEINDLASRIFPHKTSRRIYERTHFSQWHPLSKDTIWTKEEEMKLVLAIKIYSDTDVHSGVNSGGEELSEEPLAQNLEKARLALEKAALRKASAHFHPYRQSYKVTKKWERSFSPRFSYKPFSKGEDAKLLASVRSSAAATPFSEIAKKHFPDRSSDQLSQRWAKIAPDKEFVRKYVPSIVRSGLKRGLLSTKTRNDVAATGEATTSEQSRDNSSRSGALFHASDFVVEVIEDEAV